MKEFLESLKPLKQKLLIERCINYFIIGITLSLILCTITIVLSKFVFISNFKNKLFIYILLGLVFSIFMIIFKRPDIYEVAKIGDTLGFKERFITAIELSSNNDNNTMYPLVLKDAIEQAKGANFNSLYKINISSKKYIALIVALIATVVSGFIPVIEADKINKQASLKQTVNDKLEEIDELSKQIENNKLKEQLKELSKELKEVSSEAEVIKAVQKAQYKLKEIENKTAPKSIKELGQQLAKNELTKQLGQNLQNLSANKLKNDLDNLKNELQNMSANELKKLANDMQTLAQQLEQDNNLKSLINSFSEALASTNLEQINNSLDALGSELDKTLSESKELKEAIDKINKILNDNKSSTNQSINNTTSDNNSQAQNGNSNSNKSNGGDGGVPASGRGTGSIENKDGTMNNSKNLETEKVYIKGELNESGKIEKIEQKGDGDVGQIIRYDRVYNEYKQEALKSLNDESIPDGMKNLVEDYFSSLEEE